MSFLRLMGLTVDHATDRNQHTFRKRSCPSRHEVGGAGRLYRFAGAPSGYTPSWSASEPDEVVVGEHLEDVAGHTCDDDDFRTQASSLRSVLDLTTGIVEARL